MDSLRGMVQSAEAQSKITAEERESLYESYQSALDSYTYLED
jgi:arginine decarboxylase-like protein